MLEILRTLNDDQRDVLSEIGVVLACLIFMLGYGLKVATDRIETRIGTWADVVAVMPANVKRDIALDYCVSNKRMCRNLPLISPINPMDSKGVK